MDIEELDAEKLAELETMLYCQVFHSKETEDCQSTNTIPMEDNANVKSNLPGTKPRYYEKQNKRSVKKNSERSWYPKSPEKMKQQQNNPDATSPIQNNITINHYVYNVPGWTCGSDKEDSPELVNRLKKKLTNRKRPHRKKREEIKKKISEKMREQRKKDRTHVIFISDDESNDGCEIVTENSGSIDLINNSGSSNDEEVLFVPSEPCETIELDSDDESVGNKVSEQNAVTDGSSSQENVEDKNDTEENNGQEEGEFDVSIQKLNEENPKAIKKVTSNESHESNDFLDSGAVQDSRDSFDFNLHGSEFNQCPGAGVRASSSEQFVKPTDPSSDTPTAENHETESESASSTTTGTDRACSNEFSLKNIVFQEVDFPKADIFADNDLHNFEKLITPQRGDQDLGEELQERAAKEARTPRMSKTSTPKAVHTPSRTAASVKSRKGGPSAKSSKKHALRTEQGEEENEGSSEDSEETSSESEFESSEGQQRRLPELSLLSQTNTPDRKQKRQGSNSAGEGVQEQRVAKVRTSRKSKTSTPKAGHTPSRTPASVKARKGGLSAKSPEKRAMETEQGEEESSSESEFESSEGQQRQLPELSLMSQPNTLDRQENEQESSNAGVGEVDIDSPEVNEATSSVSEAVVVENHTSEESSTTPVDMGVPGKHGDKNGKAKNKKSHVTKEQPGAQNKKKRKRGPRKGRKNLLQQPATAAPECLAPTPPPEDSVATPPPEDSVATPQHQQVVSVQSPISVEVPSSNDDDGSDDDVELIEKPVEVIPVEDSDEEVDDIRLSVEKPLDEPQDTSGDDVQLNAGEEMPDKTDNDAPIDLDLVYANLTNDPSKWQISRKDKPYYVALEQRQRTKGPRCNKCRRFGHTALKCTEKPEPPRCYLCGGGNHTEPRCPNKICLNCGNEGDYTTNYCYRCFKYRDLQCRLCSQPGHLAAGCPDLWRRYHITTEPGPIKVPVGPQLKPRHEQWCSGCASQGHLEHECYYYGRQYPPSLPYIINYDNVLFPDQPQQSVALTQNTPENLDVANDTTHTTDTPGKRASKHKTPNETSEQIGNSPNEIGHTPQKRSKCTNETQMVQIATAQQKQPEDASRNKDLPTEGEPVHMLPENRLFTLAGYRLQPRVDPEMRLFDIAGYGIPPAGVNEYMADHNAVDAPGGVWPRRDLIGMNQNVHGPPATTANIPSLLSLQIQPTFDIAGGFDRLPTGEELCWLENQNLEGEQVEDNIECRLGPGRSQKMKDYFLRAPVADLKAFVFSELNKLNKIRKTNIGSLKKQISLAVTQHRKMQRNVNHSNKEIRKEMQIKDLYRRANMFLFGVRQLQLGHRHMATLRRMALEEKRGRHMPMKQRMAFYIAYDYVFGDELKRGKNYPGLLGRLLSREKRKLKQQQVPQQQQQQ